MARRTSARLTQLRRHLDRVRWRDKEAAQTYYTLVQAQPVTHYVLTDYDRALKEYYNDDALKRMSYLSNPFTEMLRKEGRKLNQYVYCVPMEECPRDRAYFVSGLHQWLPPSESAKTEEAMSRIEHIERDVAIRTKSPSKEYRDGWDRIFGEKKEPVNEYGDGSSGDEIEPPCEACRADVDVEQHTCEPLPRIEGCPSNECEIRNTCTGHLNCPRGCPRK